MTPTVRGVIATAALTGGVVAAHALPETGPTLCPFAIGTGVACPLCGLTRSALALLRGDLAGSFVLHPLTVPLLPVVVLAWVLPKADWRELTMRKAAAIAAAFVVVWGIRLAAGTLPPV